MLNTAVDQTKKNTVVASAGNLLRALDAIRNYRALALLGITFLAAALLGGLFIFLGAKAESVLLSGFGSLLAMLVIFYGGSAVGIMLMRQVQGQGIISMKDAVLLSLFSSHRLLGVAFMAGLIVVAAALALTLVLLICKIPGIGPFLFTFVFPVSAVLMGVLVFSLLWVLMPLAGPAVWAGHGVFKVIARLTALARQKLVLVVLLQFVLFFLTSFVSFFIFSVISTGMFITSSVSLAVLGVQSTNFMVLLGGMAGMMQEGGGGYMIAAGLGGGLLFAIAMVIPGLIFTMGACIIFVDTTRDMDFSAAEAQLENSLQSVRKKAEEAKERARALAATQGTPPVGPLATASMPAAAPQEMHCPACKSAVLADDVFCGNCAHKL